MKRNVRTILNGRILAVSLACIALVACSDDDSDDMSTDNTPTTSANLNLNINGLEQLGDDFEYEGWIIVDGSPISTGTFDVDDNGNLTTSGFTVDQAQLDAATSFVLSIEPSPDSDPAPATTKLLVGDFSGNTATMGTGTVSSGDFTSSTGDYILATPTDGGNSTDEFSGIWFLNNSSGSAVAGLDLPTLEAGWKYEGWAVVNGMPISTGTFTSVSGMDDLAAFSGMSAGPAFPGEDFLVNAPTDWTFPLDLRGGNAVISIEPDPDNSAAPFALKPLAGMIPSNLADHTVASMDNNTSASFPSGTVTR